MSYLSSFVTGFAFQKDEVYLGACFPQDECCVLEATKLQRGKRSLSCSLEEEKQCELGMGYNMGKVGTAPNAP